MLWLYTHKKPINDGAGKKELDLNNERNIPLEVVTFCIAEEERVGILWTYFCIINSFCYMILPRVL